MRTGMFGGTFDPIHKGHIRLAEFFADKLSLDRLLLVPASIPPHKQSHAVSGEHRLNMCRIAAQEAGGVLEVSSIELERTGKSYTCDTLLGLHRLYPQDEFFLLVGADMFMTLESWYNFEVLKTLATFCGVARGETDFDGLCGHAEMLRAKGMKCVVEQLEPVDISSTMVRLAVRNGDDISGLVSPQVERYIYEHGLYK